MLYLLSNQANTLCVTWTERYTSTDSPYVILELKSALNEVLSFSLLKAANTSEHTSRYDLFAITLPETDKGQYTYTVYESTTASVADKTAVIETGLAFVEYGEDAGVAWDASIDYVAFGADAPTPMIVDTPVIQPNAGTYAGFVTLTLTCATAGSRIYFTTDGTIPTSQNGTLYDDDNKPVITSSTLVLARAYADGMQFSALASSSFVVTPVTLTAIPSGGTFLRSTPPTIVLVSNSETAEIYTTTNGDDPTVLDTPYAPLTPTVITRYKGRAFDPPAAPSNIVDETYNIQATAPTLDTDSGTYISSRTITATNTNPSGTNEYSINGGAYVAGNSVLIEQSSVVAFRSVASGVYVASEPTTINVEIQCAAVVFSPNGGAVTDTEEITMTSATSGTTIYYTTDGSTPTTSSLLYNPASKPTLAADATVKAIAVKLGLTNSAVSEATYVVVDADAAAYLNAAGITDPTISAAVATYVNGLKSASLWDSIIALYPFAGGTADSHKYNLKDPRDLDAAYRLSFLGGWTHAANGATPNGVDGYARTFYDTIGFNTQTGLSIGVQLATSRDFNAGTNFRAYIGALLGDGSAYIDAVSTVQRFSIGTVGWSGVVGVQNLGTSGNNIGWWGASQQRGNGRVRLDQDGTIVSTSASVTTVTTGAEPYIGARNTSPIDGYSNERIIFSFIGEYLTGAQLQTLRTLTLAFNTSIR